MKLIRLDDSYSRNTTQIRTGLQDLFSVERVGENTYVTNHPHNHAYARNYKALDGRIVGQAVFVAIKSAQQGYSPHSVHSYFSKAIIEGVPVEWRVKHISNGNNFCASQVFALQNGKVKFVATISLCRKNSLKDTEEAYKNYLHKKCLKAKDFEKELVGGVYSDKNSDDNCNEIAIEKPFYFSVPFPEFLRDVKPDKMPIDQSPDIGYQKVAFNLMCSDYISDSKKDNESSAKDRSVVWFARYNDKNITNQALQFTALAALSNLLSSSTTTSRMLCIPNFKLGDHDFYCSTSMDHTIYFHDTDFDVTEWMSFIFKVVWVSSVRFLLEGQVYNSSRQHVATVYQERVFCSKKSKGLHKL